MRPPMNPSLLRRRLTSLAVCALSLIVATVGLAGCTKSKSKADASSSASSASVATSGSGSAGAPVTQNTLPVASAIVNNLEKRKSVTVTKCAATADGWLASGTAKNSGTADVKYAITVFFTNEHATVQDFATASVSVKAGGSTDWTASKKFSAAKVTNCVLRGVG
jgi:hypothetical protein